MRLGKLLFAATALAAGCAMVPQTNRSLESARSTYRLALADPEVRLRAPVELQVAERSLADAERLWSAGGHPAVVAHLAYLADQRVRIAMKTAQLRSAEAAIATSSDQRNRVVLEARTREGEARKIEADLARERADLQARESQRVRQQAFDEKRVAEERAALIAAEMRRLQNEMADLRAQQTERGWVLTLRNDLLFDSGKASLKPGGQKAVENLAQFMRKQSDREIAIEGFTDSTGSDEANRTLSEQRAEAVKQALVARGIEAQRIDARGYGPAFPVASNGTPVGRQLNRRVEVVIAPEPHMASGGRTRR